MREAKELIRVLFKRSRFPLEFVWAWVHVPLLTAFLGFMLWVRARNWEHFIHGDRVLYSGTDAWYHLRMVKYTVHNWPATMAFDPWTNFPVGTTLGQFGTLYDQIVATAALVVGLGTPTARQVALTHLFAPAVFGTLTAIPTYFLGKRLGGRFGGLVGVLVLSLTPGGYLNRSLVGFSDHHSAEVLFMATAILAAAIAVSVAQEEMIEFDWVVSGEWDALRRPIGWAVVAGASQGFYLWIWPPGMFLIGILGIFFVLTLSYHHARDVNPEHIAVAGVTMFFVAGLLAFFRLNTLEFNVTRFSLAQPFVTFVASGGCAFVVVFSRHWDRRNLPSAAFPFGVAAVGLAVIVAFQFAFPETFEFFRTQFLRVVGLGGSGTVQTVSEARPVHLDNAVGFFRRSYGLALFTAMMGFVLLLVHIARDDMPRAEHLLVLVWAVFLLAAAITQRRFDYYLALAVAVFNAYLLGWILGYFELSPCTSPKDVEPHQVMVVFVLLVIITVPLGFTGFGQLTPVAASQGVSPGPVTKWTGSLDWVKENTPNEGTYGAGSQSRTERNLDYFGTYERQGDFQYEKGVYGIMAWWDYGHWITTRAERIPYANPFQQGVKTAAKFLLTTDPTKATDILVSEDGEETRYVMLDWKMADTSAFLASALSGRPRSKFTVPYVWAQTVERSRSDDVELVYNLTGDGQNRNVGSAITIHHQSYYESMRIRLYQFHGSAIEPKPVIFDYTVERSPGGQRSLGFPADNRPVKSFENMSVARQFAKANGNARIGGVKGPFPVKRVPALQHYRLIHAAGGLALEHGVYRSGIRSYVQATNFSTTKLFHTPPLYTKTFERVPGATIEGTGPPNAIVTAAVRLKITNVNRTFFYHQQAVTGRNGTFNMTLPYSTEGYGNWGPSEGYTNVSVRATSPYRIGTTPIENDNGQEKRFTTTTHVSEAHVIGENESNISVQLSA